MQPHGLLPEEKLSPGALKACGENASGPARLMAARGLAPLQPRDNLVVLYQLAHSGEKALSQAAIKTLDGLPPNLVAAGLDQIPDERIIDFVARRRHRDGDLMEAILLSHETADETFEFLADKVGERQTEIIAQNQVRVLRTPRIIEQLYMNPNARMSSVTKCVELAVREGIVLHGIPAFKELMAAITGKVIHDDEETSEEIAQDAALAAAERSEIDEDDAFLSDATFSQALQEAAAEDDASKHGLDARIRNMNVMEKIRLATLGDGMARGYLVRDRNRLVAMSAIKSPKITEMEVVKYSSSRSCSEDVIRYIAYSREMTKNYQVKSNLVGNPKTPLPVAIKFLPFLRARDLRALARSKNVAQALTVQARKLLERRKA